MLNGWNLSQSYIQIHLRPLSTAKIVCALMLVQVNFRDEKLNVCPVCVENPDNHHFSVYREYDL